MPASGYRVLQVLIVLATTPVLDFVTLYAQQNPAEIRIRLVRDASGNSAEFAVAGLSAAQQDALKSLPASDPAFAERFAVYVVGNRPPDDKSQVPPISGKYAIAGSTLTFIPRHPLKPGLSYRAVWRGDAEGSTANDHAPGKIIEYLVTIPEASASRSEAAIVAAVYPSADKIPENHLRFYIQFSKPMMHRDSYRNLQLQDQSGRAIELPFLELGEELWDPEHTRLTLLLDPGRVKQGLKPREELGPVLEAGHKYTLVVTQGWRDEDDQPLKAEFRKTFTVACAIDQPIQWKDWKLTLPAAGSSDPLLVEFDRVLDHGLLSRLLWIETSTGDPVTGRIEIVRGERSWKLHPAAAWKVGRYALQIAGELEDTSGNRIGRSFEVIRRGSATGVESDSPQRIEFELTVTPPLPTGSR